jgi:hypothetical protein
MDQEQHLDRGAKAPPDQDKPKVVKRTRSWRKGALRESGVAQAARHLRPAAATRISGDAIRLRPFHAAESELARRRGVRLTLARRPGEVFSSHLPTLAWAV